MTTPGKKYAPKHHGAVDRLLEDRDALLTFFDFPAEYWTHPRMSKPSSQRRGDVAPPPTFGN